MEGAEVDDMSLAMTENLIGRDVVAGMAEHLLPDKGRKDSMSLSRTRRS